MASKKPPLEIMEQRAVILRLRSRGYFVFAIPNHKNMKGFDGAVAGMPDLQIVLDGGKVIWIEMKRTKGGVLSDEQKMVHQELRSIGHIVIVGFGAKDTIEKLGEHLSCI